MQDLSLTHRCPFWVQINQGSNWVWFKSTLTMKCIFDQTRAWTFLNESKAEPDRPSNYNRDSEKAKCWAHKRPSFTLQRKWEALRKLDWIKGKLDATFARHCFYLLKDGLAVVFSIMQQSFPISKPVKRVIGFTLLQRGIISTIAF